MMKIIAKLMIVAVMAVAGSCSCSEQSKLNDEARARAAESVGKVLAVVRTQPVDSFALENALLEVKSVQSGYAIAGNEESAEEFRKAFEEALTDSAPQLAAKIIIHK